MDNAPNADLALSPLVAVSPHYDDAVFSCGDLLAASPASTVITVYTAMPGNAGLLTDWDRRCGFSSAADAMRARAIENNKAVTLLHARSIDLDFLDSQYPQIPEKGVDLLSDTLTSVLAHMQPSTVLFPLGLFHEDHIYVSDVMMTLCHRFLSITWLAYEDIPYCKQTAQTQRRIAQLMERGLSIAPFYPEGPTGCKEMAVNAYQSQFLGLGYDDGRPIMHQPEKYWRLHSNVELL